MDKNKNNIASRTCKMIPLYNNDIGEGEGGETTPSFHDELVFGNID